MTPSSNGSTAAERQREREAEQVVICRRSVIQEKQAYTHSFPSRHDKRNTQRRRSLLRQALLTIRMATGLSIPRGSCLHYLPSLPFPLPSPSLPPPFPSPSPSLPFPFLPSAGACSCAWGMGGVGGPRCGARQAAQARLQAHGAWTANVGGRAAPPPYPPSPYYQPCQPYYQPYYQPCYQPWLLSL